MTPDILSKLAAELHKGIKTEIQVVYLLAGIRKIIDRDQVQDRYPDLKFHCDWALHSSLERGVAKAILKQFDEAHPFLRDGVSASDLPTSLRSEIDRISQMHSFKSSLTKFLTDYGLPSLTQHRVDGWVHFIHFYTKVIEDIPLAVASPDTRKQGPPISAPKFISHVAVNCKSADRTIRCEGREELLFSVTWTIHEKNGHSSLLSIYNSFSVLPSTQPANADALEQERRPEGRPSSI